MSWPCWHGNHPLVAMSSPMLPPAPFFSLSSALITLGGPVLATFAVLFSLTTLDYTNISLSSLFLFGAFLFGWHYCTAILSGGDRQLVLLWLSHCPIKVLSHSRKNNSGNHKMWEWRLYDEAFLIKWAKLLHQQFMHDGAVLYNH